MKRLTFAALVTGLLIALTSACGANSAGKELKLAPVSALPPQMQRAPLTVREAYQFALANPKVLEKIPCYCGCGAGHSGEAPHKSVKDCFVSEVKPDGTVIWDEIGLD